MAFVEWDAARGSEIIAAHAGPQGATLPILHALQDAFGYIPDEAILMVAHALNLTRAEVYGVVSFYHDFRHSPPGRHHLRLCRAEACQSMGADRLAARAKAKLGIGWGETTGDGAVTLDPVFCLGLCATAPSAMLDGKLVGRLNDVRLDRLIEQAR
jgi:formate dehydrogenase subunit gamma